MKSISSLQFCNITFFTPIPPKEKDSIESFLTFRPKKYEISENQMDSKVSRRVYTLFRDLSGMT